MSNQEEVATANTNRPAEHEWLSVAYVDEWVADWSARAERVAQLHRVAIALPIERGAPARLLDVGGGWGPLTAEVLRWRPNATVTLVDFAPRMLVHARRLLAEFAERVELIEADLTDENWTAALSGPYDGVVSALAIHNLDDPAVIERVYRDVFGLLVEGGCFFNLEVVFAAGPTLGTVARRLRAASDGDDPDAVAPPAPATPAAPDPAPRSIEAQFASLRAAGFTAVDCCWRDGSLALLAAC